jgi:hypothetical protein
VISRKRSDLYYTVTDDERKALAAIQTIEQRIALKKPKR